MIDSNIIKIENKEIYEFGSRQLISIIFDILLSLAIGFLMDSIEEMLIFLITFATIRRYAGGYHANKKYKCIILSLLMEVMAILTILNYKDELFFLTLLSVIGIFLLSPIVTEKNPLEDFELQIYKKKTIILTSFWTILFLIFNYYNIEILFKSISIAIICIFILLIISWLKSNLISK